jgi:Leucine-rich repeat (LRR) protein
MKKIITYIFIFFIATGFIYSQVSGLELGMRYLKLGNTYMKAENYELALSNLKKGFEIVRGKSKYWEAVAYEYLGYYYLEADNNTAKAIEYLNIAQLLYSESIGQYDGSPMALRAILDMLQFKGYSPEPIGNTGVRNRNNSTILNYQHRKLRELPSDIPINVENMSLAENKFREFPNGLLNFKNLEYLTLENNKIKSIPNNISELKNLKYLNLSNNNLKEVPNGIAELQNLKVLELTGNKIPFEVISNLIRVMPNTNILFDEYILKPMKGPDEGESIEVYEEIVE